MHPPSSRRSCRKASANAEGGKTIRVNVRIGFDNGRRMSSEVVILMLDEGKRALSCPLVA